MTMHMGELPANASITGDTRIRVNGIELYYRDTLGAKPPILLLHGLSANAHCWGAVMAAGLSSAHRTIAPDLRGRGRSAKPATGYGMPEHAADIIGLMDALELPQVTMVGHSFGGYLAIYLAAQFPDRVSHLVVVDAALELNPRVGELLKPSLGRLGKSSPSVDAYLSEVRQAPYLHGLWDTHLDAYYRAELTTNTDGTVQPATSSDAIAQAMQGLVSVPWREMVEHIPHPTLLLNAIGPYGPPDYPPLVHQSGAQATAAAFPHGRYQLVPGNHMTMMFSTGAQSISDAIVQFVADVA